MTSIEIRQNFFKFFESKLHKIVPSAPIVNKGDPSLMFTNAGMNQFKDYFLGNKTPEIRRIADTQKCLRVSGKHNDLEEVGLDSYHHTMFEMLGNWSFGDYFKKEAIEWAWELLTEVYGLDKERLYVSVFEGDKEDGLEKDHEAAKIWSTILPEDKILFFDRKDNFWEMGDTGPCGPCSEIHVDLRSEAEIAKLPGRELVNIGHPLVVEIWNLVFIQFNRKADGKLEELPEKHVDTGMGFERLCMAVQRTKSNYDTDIFTPFIKFLEESTGLSYGHSYDPTAKKDIAFRVLIDHIRAIAFTIADGQLPSNTGAGYVIRRILRRAVRYYYSFLERKDPLLYTLIPLLADRFKEVFPELLAQSDFVSKIILEEEKSFLRTLESGFRRIGQYKIENNTLDGNAAFELYDTYGFPIDLTRLIAQEEGWSLDEPGFNVALSAQKERSREDAKKETGDWSELETVESLEFSGYDKDSLTGSRVVKYRTVKEKDRNAYQIVLNNTCFYAESGGQIGDTGILDFDGEQIKVLDTQKENDLIIHYVNKLPEKIESSISLEIDAKRRRKIESNHTATHLLHAALRSVLGKHVQQRGSLVSAEHLRFDFSHFEKMSDDQIKEVELIVNQKIRENIDLNEQRNVPMSQAKNFGAMMLFGEKYGEFVRVITFDEKYSIELCGGCHVPSTGHIGHFKIRSESAIAAGVRRIEAISGIEAEAFINQEIEELNVIRQLFKNPVNVVDQISKLIEDHKILEKEISSIRSSLLMAQKEGLLNQVESIAGINFLYFHLSDNSLDDVKTLLYAIEEQVENSVILCSIDSDDKVNLALAINKSVSSESLHAGNLIREISKLIAGGGGGQAFYATAGGKDKSKLEQLPILLKSRIKEITES